MIFVKKFKGKTGYNNTPFDVSTPKLLRNCRQYVSLKEQHPGHVHPPPPQPERLVMRKDEAVGVCGA
jgi:hypothetical protein